MGGRLLAHFQEGETILLSFLFLMSEMGYYHLPQNDDQMRFRLNMSPLPFPQLCA